MTSLNFKIVSSIPAQKEAHTVYMVSNPLETEAATFAVTNSLGEIVVKTVSEKQLAEAIASVTAGAVDWSTIANKPAVIAAGATDAAARAAIGAGTSNLVVGTGASDAKAGDYVPAWSEVSDKPAVIAAGASAEIARTAIGAGTSSLVIGSGVGDAKPGNYAPSWSEISDKPAVIAAGVSASDARDAIGAGTSSLVLGSGAGNAAPGNHGHSNASPGVSGFMSGADKTRIDKLRTFEVKDLLSPSITLVAWESVFVRYAGATTITLPASPAMGDPLEIHKVNGAHACSINTNGKKFQNLVTDAIDLDYEDSSVCLIYAGDTFGWKVINRF